MENRVFNDPNREDEFWAEIRAVLEKYEPEITGGLDLYEGQMDRHDRLFDPDEPRILTGLVITFAARNLSGWEASGTISPPDQSPIYTGGLMG